MKIRVRHLTHLRNLRYLPVYLFVVLFALFGAPPATNAQPKPSIQQEPAGVSIRTIAGTTKVGSPVQVIADKKYARVGERVTFTLTPASMVRDPRYRVTVDFGDGSRTEANQIQLSHTYRTLGHYDVSASVVESAMIFVGPDPAPQGVRVSLFARPTSVVLGSTVTFIARSTFRSANIKYRFVFGDKSQTDWQDAPDTTHVYPTSGTYQAYVDIGVSDNRVVKQVAGSIRQPIEVTHAPFGAVALAANPTPVDVGQPVTLTARSGSNDPNVKYRFSFGDGSSTSWQDSSQTTHSYAASGTYSAYVDIGIMGNSVVKQVGSARQPVRVSPGPGVAVSLIANPTSVEAGNLVTFTARVMSSDPNIKYRFVFGDGAPVTNWQDSPQATHKYEVVGSYPVYVEVGRLNNGRLNTVATSNSQQVSVTALSMPAPSPSVVAGASPSLSPDSAASPNGPIQFGGASPTSPSLGSSSDNRSFPWAGGLLENWWKYPILALLLIVIGYQAWKLFFVPKMIFVAHPDAGSSEVNGGLQELSINSQIVFDPNVSEGQYLVFTDEPNVVRSVRRENV